MSKIINLFATRKDLLDVLTDVESTLPIHYAEAGMFDSPEAAVYGSLSQIPDLSVIHAKSAHAERHLLVADATVSFIVRPVEQKRGGMRYAVDQRTNPDSVALIPGGHLNDETLLAGSLGTCTDSPTGGALLATIASTIQRKWAMVKSYVVGPEALILLDAGRRLTANARSPREYDLER
jgi:hypothetical protein